MHIHFGQTFNGNRSLTLPDSTWPASLNVDFN